MLNQLFNYLYNIFFIIFIFIQKNYLFMIVIDILIMINASFINPFSQEAKEIVKKRGQLENINKENDDLIYLVNHTHGQYTGDDKLIPKTYQDLAIRRFEWYMLRKTKNFNENRYEYLFNPDITEYDVTAFFILCQATAIKYGPNSHETKLVVDSEQEIINQRLERIKVEPHDFQSEFLRRTLTQLVNTNNIQWTDLQDILKYKDIELKDLLLSNGQVVLEYEDFIMEYADLIKNRSPETLYRVLIGNEQKSKLLKNLVVLHTHRYIETVAKMTERIVEPNPILLKIADEIKNIQQEAQKRTYSGKFSGGNSFDDNKPVNYQIEAFPPCIQKCLDGIKSGGRNDAIVLFLTPFVSYSRLYPGVFAENRVIKISEVDPSLDITHNEVIPMIYDAAAACRPPLFKDQPQEKININSKLGFGMNQELSLEHEGETGWYTPMSCEKIKLQMPSLCIPNKDCQKIGNPLTYYNRKRKLLKRENKQNTKKAD